MRKLGNAIGLVLCLSVLALAPNGSMDNLALAAGPPSGLNVKVTNTPLPVQGTVNVGNFPSSAGVAPTHVSDIVVRPVNLQQITSACTPDLELGFFGLSVPPNQVLLLTGLFWSASSQAGVLVMADVYVTDGNPLNRVNIGRIAGTAAADGHFAGTQTFPVPVPLFRGAFTHLCAHNVSGVLGTAGFGIYGFFAPDS